MANEKKHTTLMEVYRKECKQYAKEVLGLGGNQND